MCLCESLHYHIVPTTNVGRFTKLEPGELDSTSFNAAFAVQEHPDIRLRHAFGCFLAIHHHTRRLWFRHAHGSCSLIPALGTGLRYMGA